jgi:hypothetical protein
MKHLSAHGKRASASWFDQLVANGMRTMPAVEVTFCVFVADARRVSIVLALTSRALQ